MLGFQGGVSIPLVKGGVKAPPAKRQCRAGPKAGARRGFTVGVSHVTAALAQHAAWYGARCVGLDVVFAVDGDHGVLVPPAPAPETGALALQGWRSVSMLCPPYGMVLYTASGAPDFLHTVTGRLLRQWDNIETLFERGKH